MREVRRLTVLTGSDSKDESQKIRLSNPMGEDNRKGP
jgi:hypothetical protein